jgi:hypothetical protein
MTGHLNVTAYPDLTSSKIAISWYFFPSADQVLLLTMEKSHMSRISSGWKK